MEKIRDKARKNSTQFLLASVCLLLALFLSLKTGSFFSVKNIVNILEANSFRCLLAVGMMCVISSGGIDLSVGSVLSLSAICAAWVMKAGMPVAAGIAAALACGLILGVINGLAVHISGINALIITLGTSFLYRGLSLMITQGIPITKLPESYRMIGCGDIIGAESGVTAAVITVVLLYPLFYRMKWGHYITAIGSDETVIRRQGVNIGIYRVSAYALSGILASAAGIIISARLNSAEANAGLNMEMDAICAVIMGGTALHGGKGSLSGTVIAVILLGIIRNGLTIMSVSSYYQQFITGALLLFAVFFAELRERIGKR